MKRAAKREAGSIELIVLGLLAALIVVLAIPALQKMGSVTSDKLNTMADEMENASSN